MKKIILVLVAAFAMLIPAALPANAVVANTRWSSKLVVQNFACNGNFATQFRATTDKSRFTTKIRDIDLNVYDNSGRICDHKPANMYGLTYTFQVLNDDTRRGFGNAKTIKITVGSKSHKLKFGYQMNNPVRMAAQSSWLHPVLRLRSVKILNALEKDITYNVPSNKINGQTIPIY